MTTPTLTILLDPNAEPERKLAKPVEEVARAIADAASVTKPFEELPALYREICVVRARAAIARLVALGFINEIGLQAIKAEEKLGGDGQGEREMSEVYRAIGFTNGERENWIIQKRWFGLLWFDVLWLVAPDTYDRLRFSSEEAANKWIDRQIELSELRWSPIRRSTPSTQPETQEAGK